MLPQKFSAATMRIVRDAAPPPDDNVSAPAGAASLVAPHALVRATTPMPARTGPTRCHLFMINPSSHGYCLLMRADIIIVRQAAPWEGRADGWKEPAVARISGQEQLRGSCCRCRRSGG